jgi:hypothetical protein
VKSILASLKRAIIESPSQNAGADMFLCLLISILND